MARVKVQITTPSNNVIKVSPGVSALSSVQLYLNELIDVNSSHGAEGHVLTQQSDGTFSMSPVATTLADLSDTNIPTPQGGDSLVYDDSSQKWVPGGVKSVNGEEGDVVIEIPTPRPTPGIEGLTDTNITNLQDNQIIRYDYISGDWLNEDLEALPSGGTTGQALVKSTGSDYDVEWADIAIDTQYHDRFATDAETFRSGATDTVELYYTAKADGDGLAESASSDTPTAGKIIKRKIYYSEAAFADPDTGTWVEFTPAPADDASFATVKAALLEYLKARTGGTVPISLKQTWEEVSETAYLLDETFGSGAEAAYSTRQLRFAQTDCMVIRRASDSTTTTIGFDGSGNISEADIISFCTGTSCTVYQWLDQSGNDNTATAASGQEPTIYTGGELVKIDGKVAMTLDGSNDAFTTSSNIVGAYSIFTLGNPAANGYYADSTSGSRQYIIRNSAVAGSFSEYQNGTATSNIYDFRKELVAYISNSATTRVINTLLSRYNKVQSYNGDFSEYIIYTSDKSGTDQTSIEENIGDYFTQNTPLLDTYTGAAAAYSLRKLRTAYTGDAVEVYNGSSYADIGFNVFGELDTVALAAHCGSNDGFVSKWYCQSGNSNDAVQTNTGLMPKIYDGTTGVVTENGKPAVDFDGVSQTMSTPSVTLPKDNAIIVVAKGLQSSTDAVMNINGYDFILLIQFSTLRFFNSVSDQNNIASASNNQFIAFAGRIEASDTIYGSYNGGNQLSDTSSSSANWPSTSSAIHIGSRGGSFQYWEGKIQEVIYYTSNQSSNRTNIETNIATFYDITI